VTSRDKCCGRARPARWKPELLKDWFSSALAVLEFGVLGYFLLLNTIYLCFCVIAFVRLRRHRRRWTARDLEAVMRSPDTPAISVIVTAYNEETTLAGSVHSLLLLNYPQFEVIVVSDGSTDGTLAVGAREFGLVRAPVSYAQPIPTAPVRGVYRSIAYPDLVMIDKVNGGGKADASNAGINAARYPLVCIIDADSLLEEHSLSRAVLPFVEDPDTIAVGGIVRIVNGCRVERGRVTEVRLPKSHLARFQVVEYLRSFLVGRMAQSAFNGLMIISGAFGLFKRDAVVAVGGYRSDTIGEDMELVARLHRKYRERGKRYRIVFQPEPTCWTEAPESFRTLAGQRNRWQRGTMQVMRAHAPMLCNPRYGAIGMLAMPYYLIFEALGPVVEFTGYVVIVVAMAFGMLNWQFAELFFLAAIVYGSLLSVAAVVLEELSFRRYPKATDLLRLAAYGVLENFGYRQLTTWWRIVGVVDYFRGKKGWGTMTRKGFGGSGVDRPVDQSAHGF
jgi:cellulose synthase/poly-beta-1,6-N-acetylglucosamine synthase-like glycosyltransferase